MTRRLKILLRGAVQGIGFRPFVFRLAGEMRLAGWVNNTAQGACVEVEGPETVLEAFLVRLKTEKPAGAFYTGCETSWLDPAGYSAFEIKASSGGEISAIVLPDIAACAECLHEILDPTNRRYRYPFTNCTHCGPRYSIIEALPYDRQNTSMRRFEMCQACRLEYENPGDRRFHAQPNACPECGPHLELWSSTGETIFSRDEALKNAAEAITGGKIVALKGIGGFQLLVDARNDAAVKRLRERKHREEKPFAILCPDLLFAQAVCEVSELEARQLQSPEAPIVLLRRLTIKDRSDPTDPTDPTDLQPKRNAPPLLPTSLAPGNPYLGVMLPYSPLHHLLMRELGFPIVATSGNLSDEPICIDEREAVQRLSSIADLFLTHDRPITRQVDDSVTRVVAGRAMVIRRARGYAPLPVELKTTAPAILATGAHLKNTVAIAIGSQVFPSQHIGDLDTPEAFEAFQTVIGSLKSLYAFTPKEIACDAHPEYRSTVFARQQGLPVFAVQHHYAHVCACMAENELEPPVLGVAWDGTGYGLDGTIWGGEFLHVTGESFRRIATWRSFKLPGGETAIREPRRVALGVLYELFGESVFGMKNLPTVQAFTDREKEVLRAMLSQGVNAPRTTSVGRLFDAAASLIGLRQQIRFEGQAAMELEFAREGVETDATYPLRIARNPGELLFHTQPSPRPDVLGNPIPAIIIDWEPMFWGMVEDVRRLTSTGIVSAKFHNTLAEAIPAVARLADLRRVALSGGCFQNRYLLERAARRLEQEGFRPYWHQRVPTNDGGIALGQIAAAVRGRASA